MIQIHLLENICHFFQKETKVYLDGHCAPKVGDPSEEVLCDLTSADRQDEEEFECFAFEPKDYA